MKKNQSASVALAIMSTVIGAGFASGREVVEFFTRFGMASWFGIAFTSLCFMGLSLAIMKLTSVLGARSFNDLAAIALGSVGGAFASVLYAVIMLITASAMASGIGEIAAILMPIPQIRIIGTFAGVIICGFAATRGLRALSAGGSFLIPVCVILYILILRTPIIPRAASTPAPNAWLTIPYAIGYACMNSTLTCCIFSEVGRNENSNHAKISVIFASLLFILTTLCNAALMPRLGQILSEPLPIIKLARGNTAVTLFASASLLLAMATTLTALLRSLNQIVCGSKFSISVKTKSLCRFITPIATGSLGLMGFNTLVGKAYPAMGIAAAVALLLIIGAGLRKIKKLTKEVTSEIL